MIAEQIKLHIPFHMTTSEYHALVESCYDEEIGYHNDSMLESLQKMIDLSLDIEHFSKHYSFKHNSDVALDIEKWEKEFVCRSCDLSFREARGGGYLVLCHFSNALNMHIGIMNEQQIFELLRSQRRLEQAIFNG